MQEFIEKHLQKIKPLESELKATYWQAALSGAPQDYKKTSELELKLRKIFSNNTDFRFLKNMKEKAEINQPLLKRQLDLLYNAFLENQISPEMTRRMVELSTKVELNFSTFRTKISGKEYTNNELLKILKKEKNEELRRKAWEGSKQVGKIISKDLLLLVDLRNQAACELGFNDYHSMSLLLAEQDEIILEKIFSELFELTAEPFAQAKAELDSILAARFEIASSDLKPWHYHDPFFQETPQVLAVELDSYFKGKDLKKIASDFYDSIGLPVGEILSKSDLYEKPGKNPHAFCEDIDKEGDVRILCNLKDTESWMETILHELGHAVYDKYKDYSVPYFLREPAHIFTTEAIAMFFGRLSRNPCWLQKMLGLSDNERSGLETNMQKYARFKQLIFIRWAMVMYYFEKELYANPQQDLNTLWWRLKNKYQFLSAPENRNQPDWAAKIHFTIAPCYYHNYVLGELLASQLQHYITSHFLPEDEPCVDGLVGQKALGDYFKEKIFYPGKTLPWNEMIKKATGEYLTPKYYISQFVKPIMPASRHKD